ncbi:MAG: GvpL/GvpF family gas vesicle protein [Pseudomonadota bacterium]
MTDVVWLLHGVARQDQAGRIRDLSFPGLVQVRGTGIIGLTSATDAAAVCDVGGATALAIEHDRVLRLLVACTDVVPVRFGAVFPSTSAVSRLIRTDAALWVRALKRVEGSQEFTLRLELPPCDKSSIVTATATYLRDRRRERTDRTRQKDSAKAIFRKLLVRLAECGVETRLSSGRSRVAAPFEVSLLVPRKASGQLARLMAETHRSAQLVGMSTALLGPLPPYSFANDASEAA